MNKGKKISKHFELGGFSSWINLYEDGDMWIGDLRTDINELSKIVSKMRDWLDGQFYD